MSKTEGVEVLTPGEFVATVGERRSDSMTFAEAEKQFPITLHHDCWLWTGTRTRKGYGYFVRGGHIRFAHRHIYCRVRGRILSGARLDHQCRNRACVNPDHLEPVTNRENTLRGEGPSAVNARKTHCNNGHAFDEQNTYVRPDGNRDCRACSRSRRRAAHSD